MRLVKMGNTVWVFDEDIAFDLSTISNVLETREWEDDEGDAGECYDVLEFWRKGEDKYSYIIYSTLEQFYQKAKEL